MAKKSKKSKSDKWTDEEFEQAGKRFGERMRIWGEEFGRRMERRGRDFGEEVGDVGERIGGWCYRPFDILGLLICSIFGIIFLALGAWIIVGIGHLIDSAFVISVGNFFLANLAIFFVISLFTGYAKSIARRMRIRWLLSPLISSVNFMFVAWIILSILSLSNAFSSNAVFASVSAWFYASLKEIFIALLAIGYVMLLFGILMLRSLR